MEHTRWNASKFFKLGQIFSRFNLQLSTKMDQAWIHTSFESKIDWKKHVDSVEYTRRIASTFFRLGQIFSRFNLQLSTKMDQAWIHTSFHSFTEIGQIFHDK